MMNEAKKRQDSINVTVTDEGVVRSATYFGSRTHTFLEEHQGANWTSFKENAERQGWRVVSERRVTDQPRTVYKLHKII